MSEVKLLDLSKVAFGRAFSRHMLIEVGSLDSHVNGTLWLSLAPDGGGALFGGAAARAMGLLEIAPLKDGKPVPYTFTASEQVVTVSAEGGGSIKFTIDSGANAVRIEGEGCGIRLDSKGGDGMGNTTYNTPKGVDITVGGGRYFFVTKQGDTKFDDTWVLAAFGSVRPVLDVTPTDGKFELIAYELPADTEPAAVTKSFGDCVEENEADFAAFLGKLVTVPAKYEALRRSVGYMLWTSLTKRPNGGIAAAGSRLTSPAINPTEQAFVAMAIDDADLKADFIISAEKCYPPIAGIAAIGLAERITRSKLIPLHQSLLKTANWWWKYRQKDGHFFYAYRYETGLANPECFKVGAPVETAELDYLLEQLFFSVSECEDELNNTYSRDQWKRRIQDFPPRENQARNINTCEKCDYSDSLIGKLDGKAELSDGIDNAIEGAIILYKAHKEAE